MKQIVYAPLKRRNLPITPQTATQPALIDQERDERLERYFTIQELERAWDHAYKAYIMPAMFGNADPTEAVRRLDEIEMMLAEALTSLAPVGDEALYRGLSRLRALLARKPPKTIHEREPFRNATREMAKHFERMRFRAANPAPLPRLWRRLTGRRAVPLSPEEKDRFQALAAAGLNGLSRSLAGKLNVDAKIVEAFTTLDLAIWAKRPEVEVKRRELAKLYHPDRFPGLDEHTKKQNEERLTQINAAATLLFNEHFGKSDAYREE